MRVIGLDLSISSTGCWLPNETGFCLKAPGPKKATSQERLAWYFREFNNLLNEYKPCLVVTEDIFVHPRRLNGSLLLIQLHGVLASSIAVAGKGMEIEKLAPTALKKAATGDGKADKETMWEHAVMQGYTGPKQDDVVDAWHLYQYGKRLKEAA